MDEKWGGWVKAVSSMGMVAGSSSSIISVVAVALSLLILLLFVGRSSSLGVVVSVDPDDGSSG